MNKPALYSRASDAQKHDAREIVDEYARILERHSEGKQSLLDVGTGSGDVLVEVIAPVLADGFTRITGIDISPKMVDYSRKFYAHLDRVDFKELNIETDHLPLEFHDQFDRVTSFYCQHWIRHQRQSLENIYKCLRKNGDCLMVFLGSNSAYNVYEALAQDPRWKDNLKDVYNIFSPYFDHPEIGLVYESLLEQVGFVEGRVEVKEKTFAYEGLANLKYNMKAINPFPLTDAEFEEYFVAFCDCLEAMGLKKEIPGTDDFAFSVNYRLVVVYARKG